MPNFDKAEFIGQAMLSVQKQSLNNWEAIVVDDCSTDDSVEMCKRIATDDQRFRIVVQREKRNGAACRNVGIELARSPTIMFLDSDDLLGKHCLKNRVATISSLEVDFAVFSMGTFIQVPGDRNSNWIPRKRRALQNFLGHRMPWHTMSPIFRTKFVNELAGFDPAFERLQDVEFHTRCLLQPNVRFEVFDGQPDCFYRVSEHRTSLDKEKQLITQTNGFVTYLDKFWPLLSDMGLARKHKYLLSTLFAALEQIVRRVRSASVSSVVAKECMERLLQTIPAKNAPEIKRTILSHYLRIFSVSGRRQPKGIGFLLRFLLAL